MISERAEELVGKLLANGAKRATWDSREAANVPTVLVGPPTITPRNACVADYVWPIYAIAPQPSDADVIKALDPMLQAIWAAGMSGPARPVTYPTAAGEMAAYQVDYSETI